MSRCDRVFGFPAYDIAKLPASGKFRFGIERIQPLRGTVLELLDDDGRTLYASEVRDATDYTGRGGLVVMGRWVLLPERPPHGDAKHFYDVAIKPELYEQLFRGATCVVDATASSTTSNFLSDLARHRGVPFVWMHATHGAWAGLVGRASADRDGFCWMCHLYYLDDQTIPQLPAAPEEEMIQPPGCLDPTFVGSQVDLAEVSLMGARLVVDEVLTRTGEQNTPRYEWNLAVLELRDAQGRPQLPKWTPYVLPRHPNCPNH